MTERSVLVTGGAGYIGSHTCVVLLEAGVHVVVLDNFANASPVALTRVAELVPGAAGRLDVVEGDVRDPADLDRAFATADIGAVVHFAGRKAVGESFEVPLRYYDNNVVGTVRLLDAMARHGVRDLVFSSSCTVYGEPTVVPITEDTPATASSPYGRTKLHIEEMLARRRRRRAAGGSPCCGTSTRWVRTRAGASARTRSACPTT